MSLDGNYINTRLESKKEFDNRNNNYLDQRCKQDQTIIQPADNKYMCFENINKSYDTYKDTYKKDTITKTLEEAFNEKKDLYSSNVPIKFDEANNDSEINALYKKALTLEMNNPEPIIINAQVAVIKENPDPLIINAQVTDKIIKENPDPLIINTQVANKIIKENPDKEQSIKNIVYNVLRKRNIAVTPDVINKYFLRYTITKESSKEVFNQMINDIRNETSSLSQYNTVSYEAKYVELTESIYIDSADRNMQKYKNPNNFSIHLNEFNKFTNITSIRLSSAIFPKKINSIESIDNYPYIILEIKELGSNYTSVNNSVNNAFGLLTFDIDLGEYKKLLSKSELEYKKTFNPPISLIELNIKLKTPDGKLLDYTNSIEYNKNSDNPTIPNVDDSTNVDVPNQELTYNPNVDVPSNDLTYNPNVDVPNQELTYNPNVDVPNQHNSLVDDYKSINFIFEVNYRKYNNNVELLNQ